jgi:arsenate reductase
MAEAILNYYGKGEFEAYSAGSKPTGKVHPLALETLEKQEVPVVLLRSKSWDEYSGQEFDVVITVCDNAKGEACPVFGGKAEKLHWGFEDPASFEGREQEQRVEFERVFKAIKKRIKTYIKYGK